MAKVKMTSHGPVHWCPGCNDYHIVYTEDFAPHSRARWVWDGRYDTPTVTPAVLIKYGSQETPRAVCHYFLRKGKLRFIEPTTHALAGMTVDLPELPEEEHEPPISLERAVSVGD